MRKEEVSRARTNFAASRTVIAEKKFWFCYCAMHYNVPILPLFIPECSAPLAHSPRPAHNGQLSSPRDISIPTKPKYFPAAPNSHNARPKSSKSSHISVSFTCHNHKRFAPVLLTSFRPQFRKDRFSPVLLFKIFIVNTRLLRAQPNPDYLNSFVQT